MKQGDKYAHADGKHSWQRSKNKHRKECLEAQRLRIQAELQELGYFDEEQKLITKNKGNRQ